MSTKVIAIGNVLMGDDGIAIRILNLIRNDLERYNIKAFAAETDIDYCLSMIQNGDSIIILDAVLASEYDKAGSTVLIPFEDFFRGYCGWSGITQHNLSILTLISMKCNKIKGSVIGIKIKNIEFSQHISKYLEDNLDSICHNVLNKIIKQC